MLEDIPLFIKLIGAGYKVYFIDKTMSKYRVRDASTAHSAKVNSLLTNNIIRQHLEYKMLYRVEYSTSFWKLMNYFSIWMISRIEKHGNNQSICCRFYYLIYRLVDPFIWYCRFLSVKAFIFKYID